MIKRILVATAITVGLVGSLAGPAHAGNAWDVQCKTCKTVQQGNAWD